MPTARNSGATSSYRTRRVQHCSISPRTRKGQAPPGWLPLPLAQNLRAASAISHPRLCLKPQNYFSIPVFRSAVLIPRLEVMVLFAEALPVRPIPEQLLVTAVRDDMVYHGGFHIPSLFHALDTQRIGVQVLFSCLLPCPSVPSAAGRPYRFRMEALVFLTVLDPVRHKCRASG